MTPLDSQTPDTVDLLLDLAGLLSLVVAAIALWKSDNAETAATKALDRRDAQDDLDRIMMLVSVLKAAMESVTPWTPGMSTDHQAGRDRNTDRIALCNAANSLRTNPPLEADEVLRDKIEGCADKLNDLAERINETPENENLWKSAQLELQRLIPFLEKEIRTMKKKAAHGS